jgi:hypothetical protein
MEAGAETVSSNKQLECFNFVYCEVTGSDDMEEVFFSNK